METIEVAKAVGVSSGTLRLWERRGLIQRVRRDPRGWRTWSEGDVDACRRVMNQLHGDSCRRR